MDWTPIIEAITAGVVGLAAIAMTVAIIYLARHSLGRSTDLRRIMDQNTAMLEAAAQQEEAAGALTEGVRARILPSPSDPCSSSSTSHRWDS